MDMAPKEKRIQNQVERPLSVNIKKLVIILSVLFLIGLVIAGIAGWRAGLFSSADTLRAFLDNMGPLAPVVFLLIHILQIVVPFIPGGAVCAAGVVVFGPVWGLVYNYVGLIAGSSLAFAFARRFGLPLIKSFMPEKVFDKYIGWLDKGQPLFNKLFAVAIFLPFFPDDIICMLAGVSKMKMSTFLLINLALKWPFLLPYSFGLPAILGWMGI